MSVPVVCLREGLVNAVIEVLVVGEDNVSAKREIRPQSSHKGLETYPPTSYRKPSGVVSVPARPPALSSQSTINHDGPFWRESDTLWRNVISLTYQLVESLCRTETCLEDCQ